MERIRRARLDHTPEGNQRGIWFDAAVRIVLLAFADSVDNGAIEALSRFCKR